jgi:hypothetical protein
MYGESARQGSPARARLITARRVFFKRRAIMKARKNLLCGSALLLTALLVIAGCDLSGNAVPDPELGPDFVAVTDITDIPQSGPLDRAIDLSVVKVTPATATNQTIAWTVTNAGTTGVQAGVVSGTTVTPTSAGTVVLRATVTNGAAPGTDYVKENISITISDGSTDDEAVFGLYIDTGTESLSPADTGEDEIVDPGDALAWLAANAAPNTKYVVLVDEDYEMGEVFISNAYTTGVTITLRGVGGRHDIWWDDQKTPPNGGVFYIKTGTTLVLDNNITLGVSSGEKVLPSAMTSMVCVDGGGFEMLSGSKISGISSGSTNLSGNAARYVVSIGGNTAAFTMYSGAVIENNTPKESVVSVGGGVFTMKAGSLITNNTITPNYPSAGEQNFATAQTVQRGLVAAVAVAGNSVPTFKMEGGEISNNNYRAVYVQSGAPTTPSVFIMSGGKISNNGKGYYLYNSELGAGPVLNIYPRGGGVYLDSGAKFVMTGGEISDNGVADVPGSGIFSMNTLNATGNPTPFLLNGTVTIKGNTVAFRASGAAITAKTYPHLGVHFNSTEPIPIELGTAGGAVNDNTDKIKDFWTGVSGTNQFLTVVPDSGVTIDAALAAKFTVAGYCYVNITNGYLNFSQFPDVGLKIDDGGTIVLDD